MKARLPWILLAASVAFNAFFAVGFLRARRGMAAAATRRGRAERIAKALKLDGDQRKLFDRLLGDFEQLRNANSQRRGALLSELVKDSPDDLALEQYVVGPEAREYRLAKLALMREFIELLNPRQREILIERIRKRSSSSK